MACPRSATPSWKRPRSIRASPSTRSATSPAPWSGWASTSRADRRPPDRDRMARPFLEVADVFRAHGAAWRKANAGHVGLGQLKVMSAIETCRTAALGGHVERCEDCALTRDILGEPRDRIAASMGTTLNNVAVRLHRGRQALRKRLEEMCLTCPVHGFLDCRCEEAERIRQLVRGAAAAADPSQGLGPALSERGAPDNAQEIRRRE